MLQCSECRPSQLEWVGRPFQLQWVGLEGTFLCAKSTATDYNSFANSVDPDKKSLKTVWSGSALFAILQRQILLSSAITHVKLIQVKCDKDDKYKTINELKNEN